MQVSKPQAEAEWLNTPHRRLPRWVKIGAGVAALGAGTYLLSMNLALWINLQASASMAELFEDSGGSLTQAPCPDCGLEFASFSLAGLLIWLLVVTSSVLTWLLCWRFYRSSK